MRQTDGPSDARAMLAVYASSIGVISGGRTPHF